MPRLEPGTACYDKLQYAKENTNYEGLMQAITH